MVRTYTPAVAASHAPKPTLNLGNIVMYIILQNTHIYAMCAQAVTVAREPMNNISMYSSQAVHIAQVHTIYMRVLCMYERERENGSE